LSGDNSSFARFIPGFDYLLVNLSKIPDKEIINLFAEKPAVKLWLLIQKHIYTPKALIENLDSFFGSEREFQKSEIFEIPTLMYVKKNCQVITV